MVDGRDAGYVSLHKGDAGSVFPEPASACPAPARIYVAGPMSGYPQLNFPAFHAAAARLRAQGHHVENPAEINAGPNARWLDCMRMDIARLVTCDALYMLAGWEQSRGALVEHGLAQGLGLLVIYPPDALEARP